MDVRTNIDLDDDLVQEAFRHAKVSTKQELVHLALQEFVANHRRPDVRELWGTDGLLPDYDYKRLRTEET
jgi:Arc/MetJ family transcription regulator